MDLQEVLRKGIAQQLPDALRATAFGDIMALLIQQLSYGRIQTALLASTGASQAVTFAGLGMQPPTSLAYTVVIEGETTAPVRVDESTKTLTGFTIIGGTATEVSNIIVGETLGPAAQQVTVTSHAGTLAAAASVVLDVVATAGTTLGRKELLIGGAGVLPSAGQVVWDGSDGLRFAAADVVTAARAIAIPSSSPQSVSMLARRLGQQDA